MAKTSFIDRVGRGFDRLVGIVSPSSHLQRKIARSKIQAFSYEGARANPLHGLRGSYQQSPESSRYAQDRITLLKEARALAENSPFATKVLATFFNHVTGNISVQSRAGSKTHEDEYERYWNDVWCGNADYTRRFSFPDMCELALRGALVDGDGLLAWQRDENDRLRLNLIEGDRLGNPQRIQPTDSNYSGVLVNAGRVNGYEIWQRTIRDTYENPVVMRKESVMHLFRPVRGDSYRGFSSFAPVMGTSKDIEDLITFEKLAVKWASAKVAIYKGRDSSEESFLSDGQNTQGFDKNTFESQPGEIDFLPEGMDLQSYDSSRPGTAWQGFIQLLLAHYAYGFELPAAFVWDISTAKGPGARFEAEQAMRTFKVWQKRILHSILIPTWKLAIWDAIEAGELPFHKDFERCEFSFGPNPTIDVGRESSADVAFIEKGIVSRKSILKKWGYDWESEAPQIAIESEQLKSIQPAPMEPKAEEDPEEEDSGDEEEEEDKEEEESKTSAA